MTSISEINDLHARAMELAGRAFQADILAAYTEAETLFRQAFELERQAAEAVAHDHKAEPSRSVLLRSAASLAIDCHEFREAERLVALALSGNPPFEICEELRDLLETVYFSRHLDLRGLELDPIEFQMTMVGGAVGFGVMESGQFLRRAESLERLLYRTVERKRGQPFRESGSPSKDTMKDFEVYFSTGRAASYAITVRMGRPQRQLLFDFSDQTHPTAVVHEVLMCLAEFSEGKADELHQRIDDEAYFNNFTALAKKLSPDGNKIKTVGFTSLKGEEKHVVALSRPPLDIWRPRGTEGEVVEITGRIRAADETSKKKSHPVFRVEDDKGVVSSPIHVPPGVLQEIVKPYWGELVRVVVSKPKRGGMNMVDIQRVDEDSAAKEP